jgi:hypothetical protein
MQAAVLEVVKNLTELHKLVAVEVVVEIKELLIAVVTQEHKIQVVAVVADLILVVQLHLAQAVQV